MENQHQHIKGYRDLSADEIALMNEIKTKGVELEALVLKVQDHLGVQSASTGFMEDVEARGNEELRLRDAEPRRWAAIAKTDLQTGLMALVRAVAQPTTF